METTIFNKLLLQTAFCCMACDGEIAPEEVKIIKSECVKLPALQEIDIAAEIEKFVFDFNENSKIFLKEFFEMLEEKVSDLTEKDEFDLIDIAIKVIKADLKIEYSEIKFFKTIRYRLKVNDERIISHFSESVEDIELFLGEDINTTISLKDITQQYFDTIEFEELKRLDISIIPPTAPPTAAS